MSRANGHSAVAAAAYRSASKLVDERTGEVCDFTRKGGVISAEIVTPEGVPVPARSDLWNAAEAAEKRKDSRVAREWLAALPHELDDTDRKALAHEMAQAIADRYGVAVDVCIHAPDQEGDERNYHVHMLATTRVIEQDGSLGKKAVIELANKDRKKAGIEGTSQGDITELRAQWADLANRSLERAGVTARIDHRSYVDQGIELTPTKHVGRDAMAMERRGMEADRVDIHNLDRQKQAEEITARPEIIIEKITATQAVFTKRDIAKELNRYIDDADQFQELLVKLEQSPLLVEMEPEKGRHLAKFSTQEMIQTERAMVDGAERMAGSGKHGVSSAITNAVIGGVSTLSGEQQNAVRHVLDSGSLSVIIGDAGTGKSFSMKVAREAWQAQGFNVRGAALAGKAADELQAGSGIDSRTLASLEFAWKNGKDKLSSRDVLVIDEAGMIGSRQLGRVLKAAEQAGAKVVLLGDDKQLAAIEAGAAFRGVVQHVGAAEITEVRRQKEAWAREAGQQFARGSVETGLAAYAERGHVKVHNTREEAQEALAAAYVSDQGKGSQIVLTHSNKDVQALNEAIREARKERGELRGSARFESEKGGREFAPGDRIVFLKNDKGLDVKNGTLGTVEQAEDGSLSVRLDSGESRQVRAESYAAVDRAYMLATPGMDRSLTYVGMTRHREEATLFAGADDFADKRAGRLVEHGAAPYENQPGNRQSYFATLENDKGEKRTIWGVDLQRAIEDSGAKRGERISLEHGGSQTVTLPDGQLAERNTWKVKSANELAAGNLVKVLGRERPKESTLDFADRRGFDGENVLQRWLNRGRTKAAEIAGKVRDALGISTKDIAGKPQPVIEPKEQPQQQPKQVQPVQQPEDEKAKRAQEIAEKFRAKVAQERGEQQAQKVEQPQADNLAGFRASVERAEAAGGGLALDVAQAQLAVAKEYQAAGKDPKHHIAAILQEGQTKAFSSLQSGSEAKAEPVRGEVVQVSEKDRKLAEANAKMEINKFKGLAVRRQGGFAGYSDRNPSAWLAVPEEMRGRIEQYNALPKERQAAALEKMHRELVDRYTRDPKAAHRDRNQGRERSGFSR
ncbi:TPA: Ti-type conjugative transfer relaxase TraA [Escherichia coli]|nr:Ti-type conjugative transfer relaxase TraA [Escherichia coli]HBE4760798.1 Ti-type conjugative transfer relaxase TraA [Escherichia coli]